MHRRSAKALVAWIAAACFLGVAAATFWWPGQAPAQGKKEPVRVANTPAASASSSSPAASASSAKDLLTKPATARATTQPVYDIEPFERTDVYAKASGFLAKIHVDIGDRVEKDQVLAELSIPEMEQERAQKEALVDEADAAVGQAQAAVDAAPDLIAAAEAKVREAKARLAQYQAEVDFRELEFQRHEKLHDSKSIPDSLLEEKRKLRQAAQAAYAAAVAAVDSAQADARVEQSRAKQAKANLRFAQARLKVAKANLRQTEVLLEYAQVRAPYAGLITHRFVDTGDFAQSAADSKAEPLFTIVSDDRLRIITDVPFDHASWIRSGQKATVTVNGINGRQFAGHVRRTAGVLDPKTHTLRVEVELSDAADGIRPGMYGSVTIAEDKQR
ncbi:MAG: efflux RND transporter periplasmic adaptor subunit [Planctomycetia bacterium]|nr:efflux RND transporter periplasmic adaptor subunit [Planctomycetia bacterium]